MLALTFSAFDPERTLDVWPHLGLEGRESYRKPRLEPLYWPSLSNPRNCFA